MFNEVSFEVSDASDKYVITTDKRAGAFKDISSMNVYTDLFQYPSGGGIDAKTLENYLNINHDTEDIRQGFITTWLMSRTLGTNTSFSVYYDHMYLPMTPEHGNRNGITYQAYNDGEDDRIFYNVTVTADIVSHNNYTGENVHVPITLTKDHIGVRGTGFTYLLDPVDIYLQSGIAPEFMPEYLHLVNVRIWLNARSETAFQMRAFNVMNDLVTIGEADNIIDSVTAFENSGSSLDDFALDVLFERVVDLLKVEIFPNISLWLILTAVLGVLLLVWFVKLFAGG